MSSTLSPRRKAGVLAVCCLSLLIAMLDTTAVNVAIPAIGRDLHAPVTGLQWVVDGYTLALAGCMLFAGSTADRVGRRRMFQCGLALFTGASLACSLAPDLALLTTFRVVQGLGASMLNPVALWFTPAIFATSFAGSSPAALATTLGPSQNETIGMSVLSATAWDTMLTGFV